MAGLQMLLVSPNFEAPSKSPLTQACAGVWCWKDTAATFPANKWLFLKSCAHAGTSCLGMFVSKCLCQKA